MSFINQNSIYILHKASALKTSVLQRNAPRHRSLYNGLYQEPQPPIPDPSLFHLLPSNPPKTSQDGHSENGHLPTTSDCAVHLEMLEVFSTLRDKIIQDPFLDIAFNISANKRTVFRKKRRYGKWIPERVTLKDPTFESRRQVKWTYFLSIAAVRFHAWIARVDGLLQKGSEIELLLLPPLDVLIIWHAFLLNCSDFAEYCSDHNLQRIQSIKFPWTHIHNAINSNDWTYTLPRSHSAFLLGLKFEPDLLHTLIEARRTSPDTLKLLTQLSTTYLTPQYTTLSPNSLLSIAHNTADARIHELNKTLTKAHATSRANVPLVENVERQCIFVDKMHSHRWIRSPAVSDTLSRAVHRYDNFLHLFHLYPGQFLVPTLDVDLVWHTHQCSAGAYREFVTERVGRFINHEDKIGRETLDDGFGRTEGWYRERFGEEYQVCLCWSCEAILSAVGGMEGGGEGDGGAEQEDLMVEWGPDVDALVRQIEAKVDDYRKVEIARKLGGGDIPFSF